MCPPDRSPEKYAAHACWEAIRLAVVDFSHAWAVCARDDATGASGHHGHRQNARYALVKSTGFLFLFLRVLAHGPYSWIPVNNDTRYSVEVGASVTVVFFFPQGSCSYFWFQLWLRCYVLLILLQPPVTLLGSSSSLVVDAVCIIVVIAALSLATQ